VHLQIEFEYKNLNKVMRVIKEKKLQIASQNMELKCDVEVIVRKKIAAQILQIFDGMFGIKISQKE
jgi:putative IMPACT (imprinted ancient) family translation regulator